MGVCEDLFRVAENSIEEVVLNVSTSQRLAVGAFEGHHSAWRRTCAPRRDRHESGGWWWWTTPRCRLSENVSGRK